ncbi:MAG: prepilin-type N-terminal cleavage/methylation domain-containing protein [Verrucomicrobia bacterium]|nr:prepilin-type N-terminal cleavage/methylation domain-containing protein [Verrucomicrobiota bacterium]
MNMRIPFRQAQTAFTLIELILVVAIIGILASHLLPALAKAKPKVYQTRCLSNLKQAGIAFHMFAHDHGNLFPMTVPQQSGGSLEFAQTGDAFRHFKALSNELSTTRILACPSDTRTSAPDWGSFDNSHLSYFVGVDAKMNYPNSLLAGDRNISHDSVLRSNILQTNFAITVGWTTNLHKARGNVLFAGGHVLQLDTPKLQEAFRGAIVK